VRPICNKCYTHAEERNAGFSTVKMFWFCPSCRCEVSSDRLSNAEPKESISDEIDYIIREFKKNFTKRNNQWYGSSNNADNKERK
jgi:hypothetical protein